jgi:hypothetical protein
MPGRAHRWQQPEHLPSPEELGKHPGEWVAIVKRKIVAAGKDPTKVLDAGRRKAKGEQPTMFHVPTGEVLLF